VEYVTSYGVETGQAMLSEWRNFWMHLFSLTRDFMVVTPPKTPSCVVGAPLGKGAAKGANTTCTSRPLPEAAELGYNAAWCKSTTANCRLLVSCGSLLTDCLR